MPSVARDARLLVSCATVGAFYCGAANGSSHAWSCANPGAGQFSCYVAQPSVRPGIIASFVFRVPVLIPMHVIDVVMFDVATYLGNGSYKPYE